MAKNFICSLVGHSWQLYEEYDWDAHRGEWYFKCQRCGTRSHDIELYARRKGKKEKCSLCGQTFFAIEASLYTGRRLLSLKPKTHQASVLLTTESVRMQMFAGSNSMMNNYYFCRNCLEAHFSS